jgi:hypothetical protein
VDTSNSFSYPHSLCIVTDKRVAPFGHERIFLIPHKQMNNDRVTAETALYLWGISVSVRLLCL